MAIDKKNSEGYDDPTAHTALSSVLKSTKPKKPLKLTGYRPLVYICSPLAGDIPGNMEKARGFCRFALENGAIPVASHLLFPQFMDDDAPEERALALKMGIILLAKCSELWYFGDTISTGMAAEIRKAQRRGMRVRHFTEAGREVFT